MATLSPRFRASDYDLTLQSCDDVTFRVHRNVLQMHSHGFATPGGTVSEPDEVVALSETASVLELLLQYLYPGPQPDLATVGFTDLAGLAEAAQKYEVWSAMEISKAYMRIAIPANGFEVLVYAAKHDFKTLADEAVECSVLAPITEAVDRLNPKYFRAFARYIDRYRSTINDLLACLWNLHDQQGVVFACLHWSFTIYKLQEDLLRFQGPLAKVLDIFVLPPDFDTPLGEEIRPCDACYKEMQSWRARFQMELRKIKKMSTYL